MGSYWVFIIDTHARNIYDDMDGSTFEHNVYCPESLQISTRRDVPLAILEPIPYFIDEMIWHHWQLFVGSYLIEGSPLH